LKLIEFLCCVQKKSCNKAWEKIKEAWEGFFLVLCFHEKWNVEACELKKNFKRKLKEKTSKVSCKLSLIPTIVHGHALLGFIGVLSCCSLQLYWCWQNLNWFFFLVLFANLWQWQWRAWQWHVSQHAMAVFSPRGMSFMFSFIFSDARGHAFLGFY